MNYSLTVDDYYDLLYLYKACKDLTDSREDTIRELKLTLFDIKVHIYNIVEEMEEDHFNLLIDSLEDLVDQLSCEFSQLNSMYEEKDHDSMKQYEIKTKIYELAKNTFKDLQLGG